MTTTSIKSDHETHTREAVEISDLPEVVVQHNALPRYSSLIRPEVINTHNDKYFVGQDAATYDANLDNGAELAEVEKSGDRKRRFCGLRPALFVGLCVVLLLIVLAAVLGGVLGTVLRNDYGNTGSSTAMPSAAPQNTTQSQQPVLVSNQTQLALLHSDDGDTLYMYFSRPGGVIAEAVYRNGSWKQPGSTPGLLTNISTNARDGTPISAVAHNISGVPSRQIYFLDTKGFINSAQTTNSSSWTVPSVILINGLYGQADPDTNVLAACGGSRLIYGSASSSDTMNIAFTAVELSTMDSAPSLHVIGELQNIDTTAGAACIVADSNDTYIYSRSNVIGALAQDLLTYQIVNGTFHSNITSQDNSPPNEYVAHGSVLGVATNGYLDYYVFEDSNGNVARTFANQGERFTSADVQTNQQSLSWAPPGHGLASVFADTAGLIVVNQNKSAPSDLEHMVFSVF